MTLETALPLTLLGVVLVVLTQIAVDARPIAMTIDCRMVPLSTRGPAPPQRVASRCLACHRLVLLATPDCVPVPLVP